MPRKLVIDSKSQKASNEAKQGLAYERLVVDNLRKKHGGKPAKSNSNWGGLGNLLQRFKQHAKSGAEVIGQHIATNQGKIVPGSIEHVGTSTKGGASDVMFDVQNKRTKTSRPAGVSIKKSYLDKRGRKRPVTDKNMSVHTFNQEIGGKSRPVEDAVREHVSHLVGIWGMHRVAERRHEEYTEMRDNPNHPDHHMVSAINDMSHSARTAIRNHYVAHLSGKSSDELGQILHNHLHGGDRLPQLRTYRYIAYMHRDDPKNVEHVMSDPKKALKSVLDRYRGTLHVRMSGKSTRFHIYGKDLADRPIKIATFNVTNSGKPTQTPVVQTTTGIARLAHKISQDKRLDNQR